MKTILLIAGLGTMAVAGIAVAQPGDTMRRGGDVTRQQVIERTDARFNQLDQNRDGRATREEAMAAMQQRRGEMADRMFARLDADGNGSISREEFREARGRRAGRGPGMAMRRHGPGGPEGPSRRMRGMGGFGEQGFVTREQLRERALARFDRLDANRDGTVTMDERRAAHEMRRERRRMRSSDDS